MAQLAQPLVLDTDLGTDVDDVLALALLLGSPELRLDGITTVYGDVLHRAKMASRVAAIAGRSVGPIVPGLGTPRSGREVYWPGHEGALLDDLHREQVSASYDAARVLAAAGTVLAIGPLTNVAAALERDDCVPKQLVLMGGEFVDGKVEHNIRCDVDSAVVVFGSGQPVTIIGLDQTRRLRFGLPLAEQLAAAGGLGELLAAEMRQYWDFRGESHNVPHDPAAALMLVEPDLFVFQTGHITVVPGGPDAGLTGFKPDPDGPHRIVTDLDPLRVTRALITRITAACTV
ncbi:nucleoside hydrolase [Kribbella deserti]|uniref:Nucleoside hydrolase n=1 Tax=Kribbella deserti TaxID=1926257 RepID=A0ABV6QZN0_9ACTN